ncbi:OLC1v1012469C2 [Oldenlandia corymbosa var. corymbosa]|uniref:Fucosyltransferase n=1 Tax=Oldenlandia corymbosa var. corymbosa TaxID=529605 RepID=A0AAV1DW80_OLDCO|nr:OLC1v1012469C2 [Oldenlandia corymbosa var. corymbosa]
MSRVHVIWNPKILMIIFLLSLTAFALFFILGNKSYKATWVKEDVEEDKHSSLPNNNKQVDELLGGLLKEGLDEKSCRSRYESAWYHKGLKRQPSSHLISTLRSYEALHKRCGPYTESYNKTVGYLNSGEYNSSSNNITDCKYAVWTPQEGLGNRIMSLVSTFLYALLTKRVLLVDSRVHISDLFCEPFPESSWLVPSDFPLIDELWQFRKESSMSYGNLMRNHFMLSSNNGSWMIPYVYIHLVDNYNDEDKPFFCDDDQTVVQEIPWQILKSDEYFVPSFFLIPSFQQELDRLFPEKDTVFHLLGRYLIHPANTVWRAITRYYNAYLAGAHEKIGIQIRIFNKEPNPFVHYMDQIFTCVFKENVLPQISWTLKSLSGNSTNSTKAVLVTSLSSEYYKALKNMFDEHPTITGEIIQVYQPSHEGYQQYGNEIHDMKAWAEMYLLSLTDKMVTSSKSTFGYVAQSLGGMKPWILYRPEDYNAPNPACQRALSMEPCFHAPPGFDCNTNNPIDTGKVVPFVRHCEDMQWTWGLKLYGKQGEQAFDNSIYSSSGPRLVFE